MVFQQISEMTIGTKFAPPYAYINMDRVEQDFSETHELQPFLHVFFILWTSWKRRIYGTFYGKIYYCNFTPNLKLMYKSNEKDISFLDLMVTL